MVDTLPASVTLVSAMPSQGTCSLQPGNQLECDLGTIAAGHDAAIGIQVTPNETGTITNVATVSADQGDPNPGNNTDTEDTRVLRSGAFSCRASALRVGATEPVVANPQNTRVPTTSRSNRRSRSPPGPSP